MADDQIYDLCIELEEQLTKLQRTMYVSMMRENLGLTATQIFVLRFVAKRSTVKVTDISKASGLSPGAVTQLCDELKELGYIDRVRSEEDRRVVFISITESGSAKLQQIKRDHAQKLHDIIHEFDRSDIEKFLFMVTKLNEAADLRPNGQRTV